VKQQQTLAKPPKSIKTDDIDPSLKDKQPTTKLDMSPIMAIEVEEEAEIKVEPFQIAIIPQKEDEDEEVKEP